MEDQRSTLPHATAIVHGIIIARLTTGISILTGNVVRKKPKQVSAVAERTNAQLKVNELKTQLLLLTIATAPAAIVTAPIAATESHKGSE